MLGEITGAWVATPIVAILISFISLFVFQNVFQQKTYIPVEYQMTAEAEQRIRAAGIRTDHLADLQKNLSHGLSVSEGPVPAGDPERPRDERRHGGDGDRSGSMVTIQAVNRINNPSLTA